MATITGMDAFCFYDLVKPPLGGGFHQVNFTTVDACICAMEDGKLSVLAKHYGEWYLWETFTLTVDQVRRTCALLQQKRLAPSLLWRPISSVPELTLSQTSFICLHVYKDPVTISVLSKIEFLWQDLGAVEAWLHHHHAVNTQWVQAEVNRRRWLTSPRRAWLAAVVVPS